MPNVTIFRFKAPYQHKEKTTKTKLTVSVHLRSYIPGSEKLSPPALHQPRSSTRAPQNRGQGGGSHGRVRRAGRERRRGHAARGGRPRRHPGARHGAQRRGGGGRPVRGVGVPGDEQARHLGARVHGAHRAVRQVQPRVLRRRLRVPRPPPPPRPPPRSRRRLLQCAPPPYHRRARRRQVLGRHTLQQRVFRQGRGHQPGGDELPGGGLPVRRRVRPDRDAGDVRRLLRRAAVRASVRRGSPRAADADAEAAVLLPVRGRRRRRRQLQLPAAARCMKSRRACDCVSRPVSPCAVTCHNRVSQHGL